MIRWSAATPRSLRQGLGYETARDALLDPRGATVRCTPHRRTVQFQAGGEVLFRKLRHGLRLRAAAVREWEWLQRLQQLGFATPAAIVLAIGGRDSVLVTRAAPGRPLDVLLAAALREDEASSGTLDAAPARAAVRYACDVVAPLVRRLHDAGLVYRDLYWNHLFAGAVRGDRPPVWIDVERVMQVRWRLRRQRWRTKDLAGLLASLPEALAAGEPQGTRRYSRADCLRFLRSYAGRRLPAEWKRSARAIVRKADRICRHRPKFG